jgi:hypothetical protein
MFQPQSKKWRVGQNSRFYDEDVRIAIDLGTKFGVE